MGSNDNSKTGTSSGGYEHAVKYLGIFGGAQGVSVLLGILRNKFASVILGASGLGIIALYNRTLQLFCDFTGLSLSLSAVRRMSDAYHNEDGVSVEHCVKVVRSIAFITGLAGMLLLLLLSPVVSEQMFGVSDDYTIRLALLSPVVLFMIVSGGELAILRGVNQPGKIARYTLWTAITSVLVAVPIYYLFGADGICPSIFIVALFQMAGVLFYSTRLYRYRISPFSLKLLREGVDVVKMGGGYIYSTILVSASIWLVCQTLTSWGGETATGLFSAGFVLVGMLPTILFAAFDSDYYPRLSGIISCVGERNNMINEHVEVHLLVQVPVILCFIVVLPWLFPLLFSNEFMPALRMTQLAACALLFHVIAYPVSFLPVSNGDIRTFAFQETVYNVIFVLFVLLGYRYYSWMGAGVGLVLTRGVDLLVVYSIAYFRYGFMLSSTALKYFTIAMLLGFSVMFSALSAGNCMWWNFAGFLFAGVSVVVSVYFLSTHGNLLGKIIKRIVRK